jgi:hypothetical protein
MASAREVKVPYGTRMYAMLCFGKMVSEPFTADRCISCISGYFNNVKRPKGAFYGTANSLEKLGYLRRVADDSWCITKEGISAISATVAYRSALKSRLLGPRYLSDIRDKLHNASDYVFGADEKALEKEDKILAEVEYGFRKKLELRNTGNRRELKKQQAASGRGHSRPSTH